MGGDSLCLPGEVLEGYGSAGEASGSPFDFLSMVGPSLEPDQSLGCRWSKEDHGNTS